MKKGEKRIMVEPIFLKLMYSLWNDLYSFLFIYFVGRMNDHKQKANVLFS